MGVEIERKFLVVGGTWKAGAAGELLRQGYLSRSPDRTVRVRSAGTKAWLTIKASGTGIARPEYEYEIPVTDAEEMLGLCEGPLIEKTRYRVDFEGQTWEVDEFHGENDGLVVAELELERADQEIRLPPWVGREVTEDRRYANSRLAVEPYRLWPGI